MDKIKHILMTKFILAIILTLLTINIQAQTDENSGNRTGNLKPSFDDGIVTGLIFDKLSRTPLEAVAVKLVKARDSSLYKGVETDASGRFTINAVEEGRYILAIELTGYNKARRQISMQPQNKRTDLDTIYLTTGTSTEEIEVEADRPFIELRGEKKIFNVDQNMSVTGGTAIEVLKNLPSVTVDIDNNISLRGGQNIKFYINGRPVTGSVSRILEQMPADQLSSVEVITNPSAKFDAEGSTGVINLVLKEYDDSGFNGMINMNAGTGDKYGTGLNLNYKTKDYNFSGSYDYRLRNNTFSGSVDRNNFFSPDVFNSNQSTDGRMRMDGSSARGEMEFYPSASDIISLSTRYRSNKRTRNETENLLTHSSSNVLTENSKTLSDNEDKGEEYSFGLNYSKLFKSKVQSLTGEASFSFDKDYENEYKTTEYSYTVNPDLLERIDSRDLTKQFNFQTDYAHPLSKNSKLETGIKYNYRDTRADNYHYKQDNATGNYLVDSSLTEDFSFGENTGAVYAVYGNEGKSFSYNLGIRGEYWKYNLDDYYNAGSSVSKDRIDYFPSVNLSQKLGMTEEIALSYARKIRRPGYRELSPITRIMSSIFYSKGNPELGPEFINSFELNFIKYFNTFSVTPSLFYRITNDKITRYSTLIDSNITLSTPINANQESSYGGELLVNGAFSKIFSLNGSFSYFKQEIQSDSLGTNSTNTFAGRLFANINLPFDAGIQMTYFYTGRTVTPQGMIDPVNSFDIALRKDFMDKKLSLNFRLSDIFNSQKMSGNSSTDLYTQAFSRQRESQVAQLTISYKFGTESKDKTRKKKRQNNDQDNDGGDIDF